MAYKPVPAKDRPRNKSHYPKSSNTSPSKAAGNSKDSSLTKKQLNTLEFEAERNKVSKIGDSHYYHRKTSGSSASKYYQADRHFDRKVDPHDPYEAVFDASERLQTFDHERTESSKARRTQAQEPFLKYGIIRDEGQEHWNGIEWIEGHPRYTNMDSIYHMGGELSPHDKAMQKDNLRYSRDIALAKIPILGSSRIARKADKAKTKRLFITRIFDSIGQRRKHKYHKSLIKESGRQQRRTIAMKRGYW